MAGVPRKVTSCPIAMCLKRWGGAHFPAVAPITGDGWWRSVGGDIDTQKPLPRWANEFGLRVDNNTGCFVTASECLSILADIPDDERPSTAALAAETIGWLP